MRPSLALLALTGLALTGCLGGGEPESTRIEGDRLTIYSSLPLGGASAEKARAVAAGQREALADAQGRVGQFRVRLVQLDSSRPDGRLWDPDQVSANAHRAVDDPTAIAYIGELDYGGSAVSLPITNDEDLLQVAPLDGLTSLTRRAPSSPRAGPERYYPSESRTFLRLVPNDLLLAEALTDLLAGDDLRRLSVVYDESIYGRELAGEVSRLARARGIDPGRPIEDRGEPEDVDSIARNVADQRAEAIVYSGAPGPTFWALLEAIRKTLPGIPIWGGAGLAAAGDPGRGPDGVNLIQPVGPVSVYPARGRALLRALGEDRRPASPEAIYGYESVRLVLDAIERSDPDRQGVTRAALEARERHSALGRYRILPRGDVSGLPPSLYRLDGDRFAFERLVD